MIQAGGREGGGYGAIDEPCVATPRRCRVSGSVARFIGASVAILAAIISWVIMAEKLQRVNEEYRKPFFITYWVHGFGYSILYVAWTIWRVFPGRLSCNRVGEGMWVGRSRQLVIVSGIMAVISFTSAYAWYYSLARTNIPANTAIYQAACVWVFLLSIFLLGERVTALKVSAVIVSVVGVALVAVYSDTKCTPHTLKETNLIFNETQLVNTTTVAGGDEGVRGHMLGHVHRASSCKEQSTIPGYVALLYSVITYAVFEVIYKKWASKKEDKAAVANSGRVLGYMGLHTLVWFWPFFLILHYSGVEPFEWPPMDIFILLIWNALLDIMFNAGLLICIALSSALFASVGTILVIPVAVLVDWMIQHFLLSPFAALGVVFILIGFSGFVASEVIAVRMEGRAQSEENKHQLQSSASLCSSNKDENIWEEELDGTEETASLLQSRRRRRRRRTVLKYLF